MSGAILLPALITAVIAGTPIKFNERNFAFSDYTDRTDRRCPAAPSGRGAWPEKSLGNLRRRVTRTVTQNR